MPAKLTKLNDALEVDLAGCRGADFQDALAKVKDIPGRRFHTEEAERADGTKYTRKVWLLPLDPKAAEKAVYSMQPEVDDSLVEWIRASQASADAELVSTLPSDADDLLIPWATGRAPWQPEYVNGQPYRGLYDYQRAMVAAMAQSQRVINASDMGLGKSIMALSAVAEALLCYAYEQNRLEQPSASAGVPPSVSTEASKPDSGEESSVSRPPPCGDQSSNRLGEGESVRGLRNIITAGVHGLGPCTRTDAICGRALAGDSATLWRVAQASSVGRNCEVRSQVSELPSAEALAGAPKLIVCPASVLGVWAREVQRWLGDETVIAAGSTSKARQRKLQAGVERGAWIVVNYEQLRTVKEKVKLKNGGVKTVERMKEPLFEKTPWLVVIADEVHRAKNRKAAQTRGLHRIQAPMMLGLSGTPLMNSPDELWSILHWLFPKEYSSFWRFYETYVDYTEGYFGKVITGVKNPDALRFELQGRLYRRTKDEVLDLPEKVRVTVPVTLEREQRKLYTEAERGLWLEVEKAVQEGDAAATRLVEAAAAGKNVYAIPNGAARTVRLRQVLSNPAILMWPTLHELEQHMDEAVKVKSAKMDAAEDQVLDNKHKQHVVFSEFVLSCYIFAERLRRKGLTVETYTGRTTDHARTKLEDAFQRGEIDVLVGTIGAMREGITLTAADTQHWIERAWVPAWNEQGESRCHRIGTLNHVTVYIYEAANTVDDGKVAPTNRLKERIVRTVLVQDEVKERRA